MVVTIAQLDPHDWPTYKTVRLRALQTDPGVFGSNHAREAAYPDAEWQARLADTDTGIFILSDGGQVIGVTGVAIDKKDETRRQAILWGSWLAPDYRGRGLSNLMYAARLAWAKNHPICETIIVSHRASNLISKRAHQKHGFVLTHIERRVWPDGVEDDHIFYELRVKPSP